MKKKKFFLNVSKYICLTREKPETDDFAIQNYLVMKEKYLVEISIFQEIMWKFLHFGRQPYKKL